MVRRRDHHPRTITVTGPATYSVVWKKQYALTTSVDPQGSGSTNPAPGTYYYDSGSSVTVTATPAPGYVFDYWELDGVRYTNNPITITINAPRTLKAVFKQTTTSDVIVVVRSGDDRLYYRACLACRWIGLTSGSTPDAPAAAVVGGRLHIVVRGGDGGIYHGQYDVASGTWLDWTKLTGSTPSPPALATDRTRLYLVVRGNDNRIYVRIWDGIWGGWERIPTGSTQSGPAATWYNGALCIFVRGGDNSVYYTYRTGAGSYAPWASLGGTTSSAPAATAR